MTLRREILAGRYDGVRTFPSQSRLAARFGVSRQTLSRVMLDMKHAGLVMTRAGAPTRLTKFALCSSGTIGIIDPGTGLGGVISSICGELAAAVERAGWKVLRERITNVSPRRRAAEARRIAEHFAKARVSGAFIQPLEYQTDNAAANVALLACLEKKGIPVVLLDYDVMSSPRRSKYDLVCMDNLAAGLAVGRHLLETGCRSIVFCLPAGSPPTVVDRMRGVASAVIESGGDWSYARNVFHGDLETKGALAAFLRRVRADAVVCGNDALAARVQDLIGKGRSPLAPRFAGFDATPLAAARGFLTVRQPEAAIVATAFAALLARIRNPGLSPRKVNIDGTLVENLRH